MQACQGDGQSNAGQPVLPGEVQVAPSCSIRMPKPFLLPFPLKQQLGVDMCKGQGCQALVEVIISAPATSTNLRGWQGAADAPEECEGRDGSLHLLACFHGACLPVLIQNSHSHFDTKAGTHSVQVRMRNSEQQRNLTEVQAWTMSGP